MLFISSKLISPLDALSCFPYFLCRALARSIRAFDDWTIKRKPLSNGLFPSVFFKFERERLFSRHDLSSEQGWSIWRWPFSPRSD
jgi:hypothetical protein